MEPEGSLLYSQEPATGVYPLCSSTRTPSEALAPEYTKHCAMLCRLVTWKEQPYGQTHLDSSYLAPCSARPSLAFSYRDARFISVASFIPEQRKLDHTCHNTRSLLATEMAKPYCAGLDVSSFNMSKTVYCNVLLETF
jgi:hypothetical protein